MTALGIKKKQLLDLTDVLVNIFCMLLADVYMSNSFIDQYVCNQTMNEMSYCVNFEFLRCSKHEYNLHMSSYCVRILYLLPPITIKKNTQYGTNLNPQAYSELTIVFEQHDLFLQYERRNTHVIWINK